MNKKSHDLKIDVFNCSSYEFFERQTEINVNDPDYVCSLQLNERVWSKFRGIITSPLDPSLVTIFSTKTIVVFRL